MILVDIFLTPISIQYTKGKNKGIEETEKNAAGI